MISFSSLEVKQGHLLADDRLNELLEEWYSTHMYEPSSLGELLMEVLE
jgi:hypothetical protein